MLYIVATPIGNLNDLSIRQAKTLASCDIILAEDTRSANILLSKIPQLFPNLPHIPNHPNLVSYYKEKEFEKLPQIIGWLQQGKNVSLISESGMPLLSDPGYLLVKTAIKKNIPFTVIPGPSSITTSLVYSGFNPNSPTGGFIFFGFLPKKENQLIQLFKRLNSIKEIFPEMVFVFFESPSRINKTLRCLDTLIPEADIVLCREMTKKFEEIIRGKAEDLLKRNYKGELTIIVK